jgi:PAS domain S-box-containing protein
MKVNKMAKTTGTVLAIIFTLAAFGCGLADSQSAGGSRSSQSAENVESPFASFRDIPGVTAQEIAAVETLRTRYNYFVYGMNFNMIEAFPVYSGQVNESGINAVGGYTARLCEWLTVLFGIPFRPAFYDWSDLISMLENGDVHFTGDLMISEERKKTYFMTSSIAERLINSFQIKDRPSIAEIAKSRPPRLAFVHGFAPFDYIRDVVDYAFEPVFVRDHAEAYRVMKSGEADAFLTVNIAEPAFNTYGDVVSETFYPLVFASAALSTRKADLEPVISVVQKALENGGTHYLAGLYSQGKHDYVKNKFFESLTSEEFEYIQRNAIVKIATENDNYPLSFYNHNENELQGLVFDIMSELELITGLSFEIANTPDTRFIDLTAMVERGEASLVTVIIRTRERERSFLLPETPIMRDFSVLVSKSEFPNIQLSELSDVMVGLVRGTMQAELFKRWFPDNKSFREYESMDSVFSALERGEVDMFMSMSNYLLSIENYKEILGYKVNVAFDNYSDLIFGFNKDEAILCSIIDKALKLIDREAISSYWMNKRYDYRVKVAEARQPWLIGATALSLVTLALIVILLYRSRNLRKLKEAEAKEREANERTQILFDTTPLASCMFGKYRNIVDCNEEVVKMFGIPDKEFFLNNFFTLLLPKYQPDGALSTEVSEENGRMAFEKGYHCFECMHQKLNGEPLPSEITMVRVKYRGEDAIAGYFRDLTEQKAMEQLAKVVTEKTSILTAILDATPDLIFCKDVNFHYIEINKAMENHTNRHRSDVIGKNDGDAFGMSVDLMAKYNVADKKIINEKQTFIIEEYIESFDKKRSLFETIKTPLIQNGQVTGLVGISRDITQREEMAQLAKQQAKAEAANRAKSTFLASMSHEIRTPMNAIMGITEIQLQKRDLSTDTKNALNIIYNSGYTLMGIINDLLDLSKIEAGKLELINNRYEMASLINDAINLNMMHIDSKPIEFKLHVDENLPFELIGDELHIKQILNNLLTNAYKYTDSGEVSLSFTAETSGNDVSDVRLTITVCDTGQGMTEEQVKSMFDAYSRFNMEANRFVEGTGLGMNIVQHLVNKMGGDISVNSAPGEGTEVTVHLTQGYSSPARLGKELAENLMGFRLTGMSKRKREQIVQDYMPYGRVLVVDDMETNLYVARGFLLPYGLAIDTALSGKEAIEKIGRGNVYDIVFMDHMMPVMDGIEAVRVIRAKGYTLPIVALTANAVSGQAEMFMTNGFDGFISKPIDIRELNASLNRFVRDRQPPEVVEAARAAYGVGASDSETQQVKPELLKIFTRDAKKAIAVLQEYEESKEYESGNLQTYIVNVHALKSALANIGKTELSGFAGELEQAGREGNVALIIEKNSAFMDELRAVVDNLKSDKAEYGAEEVSDEDTAHLRKMLLVIKDSCAAYDKRAAKDALAELRQKPWPPAYSDVFDTIAEHLLHSDFDEVKAVCEGMRN